MSANTDTLRQQFTDLKAQVADKERELRTALEDEYDLRAGGIVEYQNRKGEWVEAIVRIVDWSNLDARPWRLHVSTRNKNGEWAKSTRSAFGRDWRRIGGDA